MRALLNNLKDMVEAELAAKSGKKKGGKKGKVGGGGACVHVWAGACRHVHACALLSARVQGLRHCGQVRQASCLRAASRAPVCRTKRACSRHTPLWSATMLMLGLPSASDVITYFCFTFFYLHPHLPETPAGEHHKNNTNQIKKHQ